MDWSEVVQSVCGRGSRPAEVLLNRGGQMFFCADECVCQGEAVGESGGDECGE
jgi:hypothetical protein